MCRFMYLNVHVYKFQVYNLQFLKRSLSCFSLRSPSAYILAKISNAHLYFFYYLQKFNINKSFPLSAAVINAQLFMLNNCNRISNNSTMAVFVKKRGMRVRYVYRIRFLKEFDWKNKNN